MVERLAQIHKALADPTRLRILYLLAEVGEMCVCEIERALEITQSKASRHLSCLKRAGLVRDRRDGTWVHYRVAQELDAPARSALQELRAALRGDPRAASDLARAVEQRGPRECLVPDAGERAGEVNP